MKVTSEELNKLQKIEKLYTEIDQIYSGFSAELIEKLHDMHNFEGSLGYCTRWGLAASQEIVQECEKDSISLLDEFENYCSEKAREAGTRYRKQHLDKLMVIDKMWDSDRDDCNMYDYAANTLIDEYSGSFEDCETLEDCDEVLREIYEDMPDNDYLEDEKGNLSYGAADLKRAVIIEVGSIGRWNGTLSGLNILDVKNIGELLESDCEQWMCYVDKESGEFCKIEAHHDGTNYFEYRELTCSREKFEDFLEEMKPDEMSKLISEHSKSIGPRVAEVYGWDLEALADIERQLNQLTKEGYSSEKTREIRELVVFQGLSVEEAKESVRQKGSLDVRMIEAKKDGCFSGVKNGRVVSKEIERE